MTPEKPARANRQGKATQAPKSGAKAVSGYETALTPQQALFVAEYLADFNATRAAIRAGYAENSAAVQGSRLLSLDKVKAEIAKVRDKHAARSEITADRIEKELARIAFADMRKAVEWGSRLVERANDHADGDTFFMSDVSLIDSAQLDDDTAAAISEISQTKGGGVRIKFHDKKAALADLARIRGMFRDRVELSGTVEVTAIKRTVVDPKA